MDPGIGGRRRRLLIGATLVALAFSAAIFYNRQRASPADPDDARQVELGKSLYGRHCASCHGEKLEGQPNWRERRKDGRLPAPPHDASGHTWHHPDDVLFGITKEGLVPGKYGPAGYESDMPAFGRVLKDEEIWAVLAYIKSTWPERIRQAQSEMSAKYGLR